MNVIAIDIGTTHCKAVIVNTKGKVLKTFQVATKPITPKPGWNEQNAEEIFNEIMILLQQSISFCGEKNIACVSFSAAMHSLLTVDKKGKLLMNMLTWADLRSAKFAQDLKRKPISKKIYNATGVPIHAMSPLCKLIWMKHELKRVFNNAYKFISIKEYIFFKLFGKYIVDHSIAAATGLFDAKNIVWFDESLATVGITKEKLSELRPVTHYETELLPFIKNKLKIKREIPFVLGGSDGALANIGCGIINHKNAAVTIGTSGAVRVTLNKYKADKKQRLFCYYFSDSFYVVGGPLNNGGIALQWFIEKILYENFKNEKTFTSLLKSASKINAGADGLLFLPYLMGERAPIWDENARGSFVGLTAAHTQAHMVKAILEGICFALLDVLNAVEETCGNVTNISLSGGVTRSEDWVQLLADITGKTTLINESADASALGAALVGMKAVGITKTFDEAGMFVKNIKTFKPNRKNHSAYKKYFKVYKTLYAKLKNTFEVLSKQ